MNKLVSMVVWVLLIAVLAIVGLKLAGQGDIVDRAGTTLRQKLGAEGKNGSKADFAKEVLGWDIQDIAKKPVSVVRAGKARLQKMIDELEKLKLDSKKSAYETKLKNEDAESELQSLRESIRTAKQYLSNPNTVYPVRIKSYTFVNAEALRAAAGNSLARYNSLKRSSEYSSTAHTEARGMKLIAVINKRLNTAYELMQLLDSKLALAEVKELEGASSQYKEQLDKLESITQSILDEKDESNLPSGFTSDAERIDAELDAFKE